MPASASAAISSGLTYFVAATIVTSGPTSARTASYRARISAGDSTDHPLRAARPAAPPMREEEVGVAARAEVDALDLLDARTAQCALGRTPQVEDAAARQIGVEACRHLWTDLVAARPDRRPDDRSGARPTKLTHARVDDAFRKPAPARVEDGEPRLALRGPDGDRDAIRREREHRLSGDVTPEPVARLVANARLGAVHGRRVALPVEREALGVETERVAGEASILGDAGGIVVARAEVERGVGAFADAAGAGRECDHVRAGRVPADHPASLASARARSVSRRLSDGSSTTSSSSSASVCPSAGPGR